MFVINLCLYNLWSNIDLNGAVGLVANDASRSAEVTNQSLSLSLTRERGRERLALISVPGLL